MKLNRLIVFIIIFLLSFPLTVVAQESETYTFPIRPKKTNFLAGTMGELRGSHFHAGIDIKTAGKIGQPVHASKRGYITRIKVSTSGYGNALYMLHPDGNTSVYAHLDEFEKTIQDYVRAQQYKQQKFEIELFPKPYQFAFKKQEVIAISGNTGGSTGPHLHFEIRDSQQRVLNPLHYGFAEINDNISPIVRGFAIRPMTIHSKVDNQHQRKNIYLQRNGINYQAQDTVSAIGTIGLELMAHDKLNGSANPCGISEIEVLVNNERQYKQTIDVMSFALQRNILVHYPYDVKKSRGGTYHKLYVDDGNKLRFYDTPTGNGTLTIAKGEVYNITIKMYDPYGNESELNLIIKGEYQDQFLKESTDFAVDGLDYVIENDVLTVYAKSDCTDSSEELNLNFGDKIESITPSYFLRKTAVYLWALKDGIPQSILHCEKGMNIPKITEILPKRSKKVEFAHQNIQFTPYTLFDTLYLQTSYEIKTVDSLEIYSIGPATSPLKSSIEVELSPQLEYTLPSKTHVYKTDDAGDFSFEGGKWQNGTITFTTRELADYTILADTISPTIKKIPGDVAFLINDELSGIESFEAHLNGKWVLMKYEPKDNLIRADWRHKKTKKTGEFTLVVTDMAGNETELVTKL